MKTSNDKLEMIQLSLQEWQAATRPNVYRNRKKYTRKKKHRSRDES